MENSLQPRLSEHVVEEESSPLTMTGAAGTESDNPTLMKATVEIKGNSSTHRKGFDEDDVDE